MRSLGFVIAVSAASLVSGCFTQLPANGSLKCDRQSPKLCPNGYYCAGDSTCWTIGSGPITEVLGHDMAQMMSLDLMPHVGNASPDLAMGDMAMSMTVTPPPPVYDMAKPPPDLVTTCATLLTCATQCLTNSNQNDPDGCMHSCALPGNGAVATRYNALTTCIDNHCTFDGGAAESRACMQAELNTADPSGCKDEYNNCAAN